jgi:3-deoxy-manno-octulosonate cytidylyltransferase (CMP-KDO synthetase)
VKDKKIKILIPARFNSSRFPGKPLVLILGKPLIVRVAEICSEAIGKENVFI